MNAFDYLRPTSVEEAVDSLRTLHDAGRTVVLLAGGQSLLAAMKLGMATPQALLDLQDIPSLRDIRIEHGPAGIPSLWIGAMATHAMVASSTLVQGFCPGLAALAGGIADQQVRNMGTLGGSLAHNDPAACWPCGVLATNATVVTSLRELSATSFFQGLYTTALMPTEMVLGVRFPASQALHYIKFEQRASRFATVGVAVVRHADGVYVAVTGLGSGVARWPAAEQALHTEWSVRALAAFQASDSHSEALRAQAIGDMHASALYRTHLALVLTRQCVAALTGERLPQNGPLEEQGRRTTVTSRVSTELPQEGFGGQQHLGAKPEAVWQNILDATVLKQSIPGCESLALTGPNSYEAVVKVGLGPISVRFASTVSLQALEPPHALILVFNGSAGALGTGQGKARVRLVPDADQQGGCVLHWWVQVQMTGRLAQFGNRLIEATSRKLSEEFFRRFSMALGVTPHVSTPSSKLDAPWWRQTFSWISQLFYPLFRK